MLTAFKNGNKTKGYEEIITELEERIESLKDKIATFFSKPALHEKQNYSGMTTFEEQINVITTNCLFLNRLLRFDNILWKKSELTSRLKMIEEKIENLNKLINLEISLFHHPELINEEECIQEKLIESDIPNKKVYPILFNEFMEQLNCLSVSQKKTGYTSVLDTFLIDTSNDAFISKRFAREIASDLRSLPQLIGRGLDEREEYWFWHSVFGNISKNYILESFYSGLKNISNEA